MLRSFGQGVRMKRSLMWLSLMLLAYSAIGDDCITTNRLGSGGGELEDILSVVVSTKSPLGNLAHNVSTNLQVSLPPYRSPLPMGPERVVLEPFNDAKAGLRLTITIETRTMTRLIIRADVNYFAPNRGYASDGAEWKRLEFGWNDGHWQLLKDLGGAIK